MEFLNMALVPFSIMISTVKVFAIAYLVFVIFKDKSLKLKYSRFNTRLVKITLIGLAVYSVYDMWNIQPIEIPESIMIAVLLLSLSWFYYKHYNDAKNGK